MKIVRDGKEFELTPQELREAYEEMELHYDMDYVRTALDIFDEDVLKEYYGGTYEQLKPLIEEMAVRMRRYINEYDMHWDARNEAIRDVANENLP